MDQVRGAASGGRATEVRWEKARLLSDVGSFADAWNCGGDLVDRELEHVEPLAVRGEIHNGRGRYSLAIDDAQRCLRLDDRYAPAWSLLAAGRRDSGDEAATRSSLNTAPRIDPVDIGALGLVDLLGAEQALQRPPGAGR